MNDDEHIQLVEVGDSFWQKLGVLAAEHIAQMPEHLEHETIMYLQDRCSIYGTRYDEVLSNLREIKNELN